MPYLVELYKSERHKLYLSSVFQQAQGKENNTDNNTVSDALRDLAKGKNPGLRNTAKELLNSRAASQAKGLQVNCLGPFQVLRGDEEIPAQHWKNKNAKRLFKYLVYHRKRGFQPKEILMEFLWPDIDADSARVRLHNVLPALRRILEPGLSRSTPSSYLLRDGDSYKIDLGENGMTDVEHFQDAILKARREKDPEQSMAHLIAAEKLYKGELFSEDVYETWCIDERRGVQEDYLNILTRLIDYYESQEDMEKCLEYANKYLSVDPYAENVYRRLMQYHHTLHNKAKLSQIYERCKTLIENEMDCPLSPETISLYQKLSS